MIDPEIFRDYPNKTFVETGSYAGDTIAAVELYFDKVISIEVSHHFYDHCLNRFKPVNNVEIVLGDSAEVLGQVISKIDNPITFWLDGHYSGGDMPKGKDLSPLMSELEHINSHHIKTHTILIDDCHCWKEMSNHLHEGFNLEMVEAKIKEINPEYQIKYISGFNEHGNELKNDILIAWVG